MGRIYLGSINGFITFDPSTFVENTFVPPVVITDFFLFNKRMQIGSKDSPLKESIVFSDEVELESDQFFFIACGGIRLSGTGNESIGL